MSRRAPSKLCRRTYFLQTGTATSISEMRKELGPELADVIIETLQPSQRTAVQPERLLVSSEPTPVEEYDSERMRGQIHEHILLLGDTISQRVHGYWRERMRTAAAAAAAGTSSDDVDFCRFECRQKIDIAREQERQRYEALLRDMEQTMRQRFWEEKRELHRSYAKARALWAEFVCRKVRKQAKEMLHKIAANYRVQLEREVNRRMGLEKSRIVGEMEQIVQTTVEQQKRMDERAIQWMINQYEELLKFVNEYNGCLQVVEMTREICALRSAPHECRSTQVSLGGIEEIGGNSFNANINSSDNLVLDDQVTLPSADLAKCNVFVVTQCLPGREIELVNEDVVPVEYPSNAAFESDGVENQNGALDEESERSSVEKITIGGLTYAQPKYYEKTYRDLFGDVSLCWEKMDNVKISDDLDIVPAAAAPSSSSSEAGDMSEARSIESQPSYRESYDPIAEIGRRLLPSVESVPDVHVPPEETPFEVLFDLSKSESEIAEVADTFTLQYIRATDYDFELMFPTHENSNE
ncbi:uncharacterized protein LOC131293004 [Anopheles ziemanni]|uniref:uncharacterized protein LOC131262400 n=1 Tax=Anopheles coustani TaxID=139045 RepID=UPI00265AA99C|nr:uncharacterized protein LOC131262400 [Anopheles coustani]XP_058177067.1 uncharacterized protein LOC131293004 [Anopheles ziemanni]